MAEKKLNFIGRMIIGKEKSEDYARSTLPSNRWELFWDILKGRFGKLVIINLLVIIFLIPLGALLLFKSAVSLNYGTMAPFAQCFGLGYQAAESFAGYAESINVSVNLVMDALIPVAALIASIGVAGGAYVIRNMVWTEGIFVANDFWRGIRQNIKQLMLVGVIYGAVYYGVSMSVSFATQMIAQGAGVGWLLTASIVCAYILLVFYTMMTMQMVTMSVTYKVSFWKLVKNSFLITVGLLPQNLFFAAIALVPFLLMMIGGIFSTIMLAVVFFLGVSWCLLVWTDYSHWIYDNMLKETVPGAQKNRGIYEKIKKSDSEALKKYGEQMVMARSSLAGRPIKPITDDELTLAELPTAFSRSDIVKLDESRKIIYEDHEKYVEEHKNDPEFMKSEEEIELETKLQEREKRIEQAKKELQKRNKGKKK